MLKRPSLFPQLEVITLYGGHVSDESKMAIIQGLEEGSYANIKKLDLRAAMLEPMSAIALARALTSDSFTSLQELVMGRSNVCCDDRQKIDDGAVAEIVKGLRHCPDLKCLDLCFVRREDRAQNRRCTSRLAFIWVTADWLADIALT